MPSHRYLTYCFLLFLGLSLAVGNIFFAARRSTIPLQFASRIVEKEVRGRERPGKHDVYLLHLQTGDVLQVDAVVFEGVEVGDQVCKAAWSRTLEHQGQSLSLAWSPDFRGMVLAMPTVFGVMLLTAAYVMARDATRQPQVSFPVARLRAKHTARRQETATRR